ncbi:MAG TPA: pilus assembly protein CpaA [Oceanicaulis sp.]|jgi:prepilin peptidase CpaA|nr:pilus assembly protein CpaA [Oceanicaulis sp.]
MLVYLCVSAAVLLTLLAALEDVRRFTISNWIPGALIALWLVYAPLSGLGWQATGLSLLTGLGVLALMMALWMPGWLGGGDAKLIAALALWFGWPSVLTFLLLAMICGGALAAVLLAARRFAPALPVPPERLAASPLAHGAPVPYGVAIAGGMLWALPHSPLMAALGG